MKTLNYRNISNSEDAVCRANLQKGSEKNVLKSVEKYRFGNSLL